MEENNKGIIEEFIEKYKNNEASIKDLAVVITRIFNIDFIEANKIAGRLVSIYGFNITLMSILDTISMDNFDTTNLIALLNYFAKRRVEENLNDYNLPPIVEPKAPKKFKTVKLRSPFDE